VPSGTHEVNPRRGYDALAFGAAGEGGTTSTSWSCCAHLSMVGIAPLVAELQRIDGFRAAGAPRHPASAEQNERAAPSMRQW
jgi:hypothetical protein